VYCLAASSAGADLLDFSMDVSYQRHGDWRVWAFGLLSLFVKGENESRHT
jgi:hypothetical protein